MSEAMTKGDGRTYDVEAAVLALRKFFEENPGAEWDACEECFIKSYGSVDEPVTFKGVKRFNLKATAEKTFGKETPGVASDGPVD